MVAYQSYTSSKHASGMGLDFVLSTHPLMTLLPVCTRTKFIAKVLHWYFEGKSFRERVGGRVHLKPHLCIVDCLVGKEV